MVAFEAFAHTYLLPRVFFRGSTHAQKKKEETHTDVFQPNGVKMFCRSGWTGDGCRRLEAYVAEHGGSLVPTTYATADRYELGPSGWTISGKKGGSRPGWLVAASQVEGLAGGAGYGVCKLYLYGRSIRDPTR